MTIHLTHDALWALAGAIQVISGGTLFFTSPARGSSGQAVVGIFVFLVGLATLVAAGFGAFG